MSVQTQADRPGATAAPPSERRPARGPLTGGSGAALLFLLGEAVFLGLLRWWQPRFFFIDDKIMQYMPVWHWLGANADGLRVPLMDADQGAGGAFTADLQYGVLDPFHWLLAGLISRQDGLNAVGWGLHALAVVVLGLGVVALTRRLGASAGWAAAAALGAANSGFLLWFAGSWWPAAWGTALLPWLWWSLIGRTRWAVPAAVLAAYLTGASGYPYALPFAGLVVVGVLVERGLQARTWRLWRDGALLRRIVAAAGGLLTAMTGLLAAQGMAEVSARAAVNHDPKGNAGNFIPNLLDVLVGGPTTSVQATGWWAEITPSALAATGWFVLPLLALVPWRRVRALGPARVPGLVPGVVVLVGAVLATQLPTDVGSFRLPIRYLLVVGVVAPVVVVALVAAVGLAVCRRRLVVAGALVVAQGLLAVLRVPALTGWHALAVGLGLLTLALLGVALARRPRWVVVPVLLMTLAAPFLSVAAAIGYHSIQLRAAGLPETDLPDHGVWDGYPWPASVSGIADLALEPGLDATVMVVQPAGEDRGLASGLPVGSASLYSDMRVGFGYTSIGQAGWSGRWCQDFLGEIGPACTDLGVARLLEQVPGTGTSWLEVMSKDVLLVEGRVPAAIPDSLGDDWRLVGTEGPFRRFERTTPTEGRVTWTEDGVTDVRARSVGPDDETYTVSWSAGGDHRVITRIPYWPGYRATLDGRPLALDPVEDTVVALDLPDGGGSGELRIWFEPPGLRLGLAAAAVGALLGLVATGAEVLRRRPGREDVPAA